MKFIISFSATVCVFPALFHVHSISQNLSTTKMAGVFYDVLCLDISHGEDETG
jgi:hypothetical protein